MKKIEATCDFCKRTGTYVEGKGMHPTGWDTFCWDDVVNEMCDNCFEKLAEFIKTLGYVKAS